MQKTQIEQVAWIIQNIGFKLNGYERLGSPPGAWYVSVDENGTVRQHTRNTEGGIPPGAMPVDSGVSAPTVAKDIARRLIQASKVERQRQLDWHRAFSK